MNFRKFENKIFIKLQITRIVGKIELDIFVVTLFNLILNYE